MTIIISLIFSIFFFTIALFLIMNFAHAEDPQPYKKQIDKSDKEIASYQNNKNSWQGIYALGLMGTGHFTQKINTGADDSHTRQGLHSLSAAIGINDIYNHFFWGGEIEIGSSLNELGQGDFTTEENIKFAAKTRIGIIPDSSLNIFATTGLGT